MDKAVEALFGALGWDKAQPEGPDAVIKVVLSKAITAADEARAVTDEEIIVECMKTISCEHIDEGGVVIKVLAALHTAGFKVIRG